MSLASRGASVAAERTIRSVARRMGPVDGVRGILIDLAAEEAESERLKRQEDEIVARLRAHGSGFSPGDRLTRDQLHERHALR